MRMKRFALVFFLMVFGFCGMAMAQEPTEAVTIDPVVVAAILAIVGGGLVTTITNLIKSALKVSGTLAVIINGLVAIATTAIYFLFISPPFSWVKFALYAVVVFGEATGYYHIYAKTKAEIELK